MCNWLYSIGTTKVFWHEIKKQKFPIHFQFFLFSAKQTLRVFHLSYFKYVLQISFNSFQFISSKFWKSVIFNLFEVSFLISNEINFLNKFFSEISMITSIITYSRTTDYLFFILSGKWVHDFWYQLVIYFSIFWVVNDCLISDTEIWIFWISSLCEFILEFKKVWV